MNCKFCQSALEEGNLICPSCGKDNAEEVLEAVMEPETVEEVAAEEKVEETTTEETTTEETAGLPAEEAVEMTEETEAPEDHEPVEEAEEETAAQAEKKGIVLTPGKLVLIIGAVVVLTALVVGLILQGAGFQFVPKETTATNDATVPTDGDPDTIAALGTYTVSDKKAAKARKKTIATAGEDELTNGMLQVFYWTQVQNFVAQNGSYAYYYYGFDYTQPLDTQIYPLDDRGITWQQYFLETALESWHTYQAMAAEATAKGYTLDEESKADIAAMPETLATQAGVQGFESAEAYLEHSLGTGATMEDYLAYMELYYQGYMYFQDEYAKMQPTDEEVEAYFTEHEDEYAAGGITWKTALTVDIRHILILPEGATTETIRSETFSEEAWAAGKEKAQSILDEWLAGEATEDSFAELANAYSADGGSNTNGGLYTGVSQGEMVDAFDAWCFDETREVGHYEIVETELGYHIMYFSGKTLAWSEYAKSDLLSERGNLFMMEIVEKYPMDVDYKKIKLGYVNLAS